MLNEGHYKASPINPLDTEGVITNYDHIDSHPYTVKRNNGKENNYRYEDLRSVDDIKLQVKGKVKEKKTMDPQAMAAVLDKAMQVIKDNGLQDQLAQPDSTDTAPPPPPSDDGNGNTDGGGGGGNGPQRNTYVFFQANNIGIPLVAENIKQAMDYMGAATIERIYQEPYSPSEEDKQRHVGLVPPFYH